MNNYIPNTSAIPNILIDYWMPKLTPAEFKVLICIARKTYGWHKDVDRISLKQIEKMTGLSRFGIVKNLVSLEEYGLLTKIKSKTSDGDDAPNQYEINVNCIGGGSLLSIPPVGNSVDQGVGNSVDPQKKLLTKETITKEEYSREALKQPTPISKKQKQPLPTAPIVERCANHPEQSKFVTHFKEPLIGISEEDHKNMLEKHGAETVKAAYEFLAEWKIDKSKTEPKEIHKHTDAGRLKSWGFKAIEERNNSKAFPRSKDNLPVPKDPKSINEQKKAICDEIRGIVAPLCNDKTYFNVSYNEVSLGCKIKDVSSTFRFGDTDGTFKDKLLKQVEIIFPSDKEKLKELLKKYN